MNSNGKLSLMLKNQLQNIKDNNMPKPLPYERQEDFVNRCVEELITEENKDKSQAVAMCYQIWNRK